MKLMPECLCARSSVSWPTYGASAGTLPRSAVWSLKPHATFSDCLTLVRRTIRAEENDADKRLDRLLEQLAATA